jgi:protein-tyrosine-phosphatase
MRSGSIIAGIVAVNVALWSVQAAHGQPAPNDGDKTNDRVKTTVVFVCEHGAARSVIAAAYFNQIAAERHLPYHAVARGTSPQDDLSAATVKGLEADGVTFDRTKPKGLSEADARGAVRIVAFCPVPKAFSSLVRVDEHDDVPEISKDYSDARDKIVAYVMQLIDELQQDR